MATMELLMVRHGQSQANIGASSDPDCDMTDLGREQAQSAARRLAALDLRDFQAITSPYRRAVCTAEIIARATGLKFAEEPAVREWGATATVGDRTFEQEPVEQAVERLQAFLRERRGQRLVIISHAAPIAILTQLAWGEPPNTQGQFWLGVGNCCPRWLKTTVGA